MNFSHLFTLPKRTASLSFVFSGPTKLVLDNCEGFQGFLWRRINKANGLFLPWNFLAHIYFLKISVLGVGQKKVEEVAFLPPRSGTRVCWIWRTTAIFDLRGFSKQGAGAGEEGTWVLPRDPTSLSGSKRSAAGINTHLLPLDCFQPRDLIKTPKFWEAHYGKRWVKKKSSTFTT